MVATGKVEILMASYNGSQYIRQQIDSILTQNNTNWKLIISDDKSSDGTPQIIHEYVEKYPEKIYQYSSGRHFGNAKDHFFYLISISKGDYVFLCDQDDIWNQDKVQESMRAILIAEEKEGKQTPLLVFSDQLPVDQYLQPLGSSLMIYQKQNPRQVDYQSLLMQNVVTGGSLVMNRALIDKVIQKRLPAEIIMHDWWIAIVAARFGKVIYLDKILSSYRQHEHNVIGAKKVGSYRYLIQNITNLKKVKDTILQKKYQAKAFREIYESELNEEDLSFLRQFEKPRSGLAFYRRYRKKIYSPLRKAGMILWG